MPDTATCKLLRDALEADPSNADLRLIYADCLEELGDAEGARRQRMIAGLPTALRGLACAAARFVERTIRPAVLALTLAAALTLLDPMQHRQLESGGLRAE
jgi:uncharacterized protein (TIGR02996 family)